jgi:hypothetical protein
MDKPALVALRDRREAVIQLLVDGFANELLAIDAFEERTAFAHQATTVAALDALVADLAPLPAGATSRALVQLVTDPALEAQRPIYKRQLALFSSVERCGAWMVPRVLEVTAVFGNAELDLREAQLAPGVTTVRVRAVFGNIEIVVPPQLAVQCDGRSVLGSFEGHSSAVADPDRPMLHIEGSALFSSVEVTTRLPGESHSQARKRERRALDSAHRD